MSNKLYCYLLIGAPGVGKGTFAKLISRKLDWEHIAIGDLIREEIRKSDSKYGKEFKDFVSQGKLIPDELVNNLAIDKLKSSSKPILLDGFPRNVPQAKVLDSECATLGNRAIVGINITLRRDIIIQKLLGRVICKTCKDEFNFANFMNDGFEMPAITPKKDKCKLGSSKCNFIEERRPDDNLETITKRFEEYEAKTLPLLEYYSAKKALWTFPVKKGVADTPELIELMERISD